MELFQTGGEPEFVVQHIAKYDMPFTGTVRLYMASERNGILRLEYTVLTSCIGLTEMSRAALRIASNNGGLLIAGEATMQ